MARDRGTKIRRATMNRAKYSCFCRIAPQPKGSSPRGSTTQFTGSSMAQNRFGTRSRSDPRKRSTHLNRRRRSSKNRGANHSARFRPTLARPSVSLGGPRSSMNCLRAPTTSGVATKRRAWAPPWPTTQFFAGPLLVIAIAIAGFVSAGKPSRDGSPTRYKD